MWVIVGLGCLYLPYQKTQEKSLIYHMQFSFQAHSFVPKLATTSKRA